MYIALIVLSFIGSVTFSVLLRKIDRSKNHLHQMRRAGELQSHQIEELVQNKIQAIQDASLDFEVMLRQSRQTKNELTEDLSLYQEKIGNLKEDRDLIDRIAEELTRIASTAHTVGTQVEKLESGLKTLSDSEEEIISLRRHVESFHQTLEVRGEDAREHINSITGKLIEEMEDKSSHFIEQLFSSVQSLKEELKLLDEKSNLQNKDAEDLNERIGAIASRLEEKWIAESSRMDDRVNALDRKLTERVGAMESGLAAIRSSAVESLQSETARIRSDLDNFNLEAIARRDDILNDARRMAEGMKEQIHLFQEKFLDVENRLLKFADKQKNELQERYLVMHDDLTAAEEKRLSVINERVKHLDEEVQAAKDRQVVRIEAEAQKLKEELRATVKELGAGVEKEMLQHQESIRLIAHEEEKNIQASSDDLTALRDTLSVMAQELKTSIRNETDRSLTILRNEKESEKERLATLYLTISEKINEVQKTIDSHSDSLHSIGDDVKASLQNELERSLALLRDTRDSEEYKLGTLFENIAGKVHGVEDEISRHSESLGIIGKDMKASLQDEAARTVDLLHEVRESEENKLISLFENIAGKVHGMEDEINRHSESLDITGKDMKASLQDEAARAIDLLHEVRESEENKLISLFENISGKVDGIEKSIDYHSETLDIAAKNAKDTLLSETEGSLARLQKAGENEEKKLAAFISTLSVRMEDAEKNLAHHRDSLNVTAKEMHASLQDRTTRVLSTWESAHKSAEEKLSDLQDDFTLAAKEVRDSIQDAAGQSIMLLQNSFKNEEKNLLSLLDEINTKIDSSGKEKEESLRLSAEELLFHAQDRRKKDEIRFAEISGNINEQVKSVEEKLSEHTNQLHLVGESVKASIQKEADESLLLLDERRKAGEEKLVNVQSELMNTADNVRTSIQDETEHSIMRLQNARKEEEERTARTAERLNDLHAHVSLAIEKAEKELLAHHQELNLASENIQNSIRDTKDKSLVLLQQTREAEEQKLLSLASTVNAKVGGMEKELGRHRESFTVVVDDLKESLKQEADVSFAMWSDTRKSEEEKLALLRNDLNFTAGEVKATIQAQADESINLLQATRKAESEKFVSLVDEMYEKITLTEEELKDYRQTLVELEANVKESIQKEADESLLLLDERRKAGEEKLLNVQSELMNTADTVRTSIQDETDHSIMLLKNVRKDEEERTARTAERLNDLHAHVSLAIEKAEKELLSHHDELTRTAGTIKASIEDVTENSITLLQSAREEESKKLTSLADDIGGKVGAVEKELSNYRQSVSEIESDAKLSIKEETNNSITLLKHAGDSEGEKLSAIALDVNEKMNDADRELNHQKELLNLVASDLKASIHNEAEKSRSTLKNVHEDEERKLSSLKDDLTLVAQNVRATIRSEADQVFAVWNDTRNSMESRLATSAEHLKHLHDSVASVADKAKNELLSHHHALDKIAQEMQTSLRAETNHNISLLQTTAKAEDDKLNRTADQLTGIRDDIMERIKAVEKEIDRHYDVLATTVKEGQVLIHNEHNHSLTLLRDAVRAEEDRLSHTADQLSLIHTTVNEELEQLEDNVKEINRTRQKIEELSDHAKITIRSTQDEVLTEIEKRATAFLDSQDEKLERANKHVEGKISEQLAKMFDRGNLHLDDLEKRTTQAIKEAVHGMESQLVEAHKRFVQMREDILNEAEEARLIKAEVLTELKKDSSVLAQFQEKFKLVDRAEELAVHLDEAIDVLSNRLALAKDESARIEDYAQTFESLRFSRKEVESELKLLEAQRGRISDVEDRFRLLDRDSAELNERFALIQAGHEIAEDLEAKLQNLSDYKDSFEKYQVDLIEKRKFVENAVRYIEKSKQQAKDAVESADKLLSQVERSEIRQEELEKYLQDLESRAAQLANLDREIQKVESRFEQMEGLMNDLETKHKQVGSMSRKLDEVRGAGDDIRVELASLVEEAEEKMNQLSVFFQTIEKVVDLPLDEDSSEYPLKGTKSKKRKGKNDDPDWKQGILTLYLNHKWSPELIAERTKMDPAFVRAVIAGHS